MTNMYSINLVVYVVRSLYLCVYVGVELVKIFDLHNAQKRLHDHDQIGGAQHTRTIDRMNERDEGAL